jgi:hypothetical protein
MKPKFRLTSLIATVSSQQMREAIEALPAYCGASSAIREAMSVHAHKAKSLRTPPEFQPPKTYADRLFLNAVVDAEAKQDYEILAKRCGITMSELVLRCLSAYVLRSAGNPESLT